MSIPYMNVKISQMLFLIGLFLATLGVFASNPEIGLNVIILGLLQFIGLFLTGWALLSFAVAKQLNKNQKLIAMVFALVVLTGVLGLKVVFDFSIAPYV